VVSVCPVESPDIDRSKGAIRRPILSLAHRVGERDPSDDARGRFAVLIENVELLSPIRKGIPVKDLGPVRFVGVEVGPGAGLAIERRLKIGMLAAARRTADRDQEVLAFQRGSER
jgi:hypothetical protein